MASFIQIIAYILEKKLFINQFILIFYQSGSHCLNIRILFMFNTFNTSYFNIRVNDQGKDKRKERRKGETKKKKRSG